MNLTRPKLKRGDKQLQRECFKFFDFIFSQLATDGKKWNNYVMKLEVN
jgi:hypothetical protein